jgi:hypothetical protein
MDNDPYDSLEAQMMVDWVSQGITIAECCRRLSVGRTTVYAWIAASERFRDAMEAARAAGYDAIADECFNIADDATKDTLENGKPDKEWMARSKLRIETRLKLLAKWHPKKYGEKLEIESKSATVAIPVTDDPIEAQKAYEALISGK